MEIQPFLLRSSLMLTSSCRGEGRQREDNDNTKTLAAAWQGHFSHPRWSGCTCLNIVSVLCLALVLRHGLNLGHVNRIAVGVNCSRDLHHLASKLFWLVLVIEFVTRTIRVS